MVILRYFWWFGVQNLQPVNHPWIMFLLSRAGPEIVTSVWHWTTMTSFQPWKWDQINFQRLSSCVCFKQLRSINGFFGIEVLKFHQMRWISREEKRPLTKNIDAPLVSSRKISARIFSNQKRGKFSPRFVADDETPGTRASKMRRSRWRNSSQKPADQPVAFARSFLGYLAKPSSASKKCFELFFRREIRKMEEICLAIGMEKSYHSEVIVGPLWDQSMWTGVGPCPSTWNFETWNIHMYIFWLGFRTKRKHPWAHGCWFQHLFDKWI